MWLTRKHVVFHSTVCMCLYVSSERPTDDESLAVITKYFNNVYKYAIDDKTVMFALLMESAF